MSNDMQRQRNATARFVVTLVLLTVWLFLFWAVTGCTATTYERQNAQLSMARGCYCHTVEAKESTFALGQAAIVAAELEKAKQLKVNK